MKTLLIVVLPMIAAVQAVPDSVLTAAGSLAPTAALTAIAFWLITRTLPDKDKRFAEAVREIADRQHDDSQKLNETMTQMRATCAAVQAASKV